MADSEDESPLEILYDHKACICVAKPAGLLTQAPHGIDNLEQRVREYCLGQSSSSSKIYLAIIHRLDRPVSGAIVFCRNVRAANRLAEQFRQRTVRKTYWAIVEGVPQLPTDHWIDHVRKIPDVAKGEIVSTDYPNAKVAELTYRMLSTNSGNSLLEIELGTGRYHQIRLQCAARGLPVVGDYQYGAERSFGPDVEDPRHRHIALHARSLSFRHPMIDEQVTVTAKLSLAWKEFDAWPILGKSIDEEETT